MQASSVEDGRGAMTMVDDVDDNYDRSDCFHVKQV